MREYEALWQALQVGAISLKNRVVVTPHALAYGRDNVMTQQSVDYYEERAKGGAGLILTEAQSVHPTSRGMMLRTLQAWPTDVIPVCERLARAVHKHGAKVFVDLSHFGAEDNNTTHLDNWRSLWSASGLPSPTYGEIPWRYRFVLERARTVRETEGRGSRTVDVGTVPSGSLAPVTGPRGEGKVKHLLDFGDCLRRPDGPGRPCAGCAVSPRRPDGPRGRGVLRARRHLRTAYAAARVSSRPAGRRCSNGSSPASSATEGRTSWHRPTPAIPT
ncbi:MAG TPA: hypothetical protein VG674_06435 [Amycolatopsis sp.]|nr:hypothetical protein [Amycolatopsis sp.]